MLKIFFSDMPEAAYDTSIYFKNDYDPAWLKDPFVQQMILDVDHSKVLDVGAVESPVLGIIPPTSLSGGVKALILIDKEPDRVFNASNCGDNCAKWLLKMGERKDVTINLRHMMDFGDDPFEVLILNNMKKAHGMLELLEIGGEFV